MKTPGKVVSAALTLHALPTLLTDLVLIGHAKRADVVFTPPQWFAMCAHMHNENPNNFFLKPYRKDGKVKYVKSFRADAEKRMLWVWDTITGKAKFPASIGFYPTNAQRQSRWAAMDFDSHDENKDRARTLAHKAFALLIREPQLYVALCTSAGDPVNTGWHLFIFTADFYPCEDWTRLLKQVADQIGAPIKSGVCEIFPDDFRGRCGHGIRAPGTWNPKTGDCGLILRETITNLLPASLPAGLPKERNCFLGTRSTTREDFSSLPSSEIFKITAPGTRHAQLLKLVGALFHQCGREIARKIAERQHAEASPAPVASLAQHLAEFDLAWAGMQRNWLRKLSPTERTKFDALTTDNERDGFKILQNWSKTETPDFKAHCKTLAARLGITLAGAAAIRLRFCALGILRKTAEYVPQKLAARYQWIASHEPKRKQSAWITPQWNGDPGDARLKENHR